MMRFSTYLSIPLAQNWLQRLPTAQQGYITVILVPVHPFWLVTKAKYRRLKFCCLFEPFADF